MSRPPRSVWLFRHGQTDWNQAERFQGHLDIPLNENGRSQARELAPLLARAGIQAILSSDLSRARETADIVARALKIPVWSDERLREAHLGDAQGLTREEIEVRFGEELATRWRSTQVTDADVSYPGGESGTQVLSRTLTCLTDWLSREQTPASLAVATHGGVIRRLMQHLLPKDYGHVPIPNTVVYELVLNPLGRLALPAHSPLLSSAAYGRATRASAGPEA